MQSSPMDGDTPAALADSSPEGAPARRGYRDNVRRLAAVQKSSYGAAAYSRWVNRPIGRRLAAAADVIGLNPDGVTALSAAASAVGIIALAIFSTTVTTAVVVALLLVLGYALDSADGQLARLQGSGSPAGEFLDHMVDAVKTSALHLAVLIALWRHGHATDGPVLLLPVVFVFVAAVFFFGIILAEQLRRQHQVTPRVRDGGPAPVLRSLVVLPNDYGLLCLAFLLWGWQQAFLIIYGFLLAANACYLVLGSLRWYREMKAVGGRARSAAPA